MYQEIVSTYYTFLGACVLYMLNRINNKQPFSLFSAINMGIKPTTKPLLIICDMMLSSIIGAAVVVPLVQPHTAGQCIISGLGMTGIFSAFSKQVKDEE